MTDALFKIVDKRIKTFNTSKVKNIPIEILTLTETVGIKENEKRIFQINHTLIFKELDTTIEHTKLTVLCEFEFKEYLEATAELLYNSIQVAHLFYVQEIEKLQFAKGHKIS